MANNATGSISASVLNDIAKMNIGGTLNYTPISGDRWLYFETIADASSTALVNAGIQYHELGVRTDAAEKETATGDIVRWMCIKHTGTTCTNDRVRCVINFNYYSSTKEDLESLALTNTNSNNYANKVYGG